MAACGEDPLDTSSVGLCLPPAFAFSKEYQEVEARTVLQAANAYRQSISPPYQSDFRVLAVLVYEDARGSLHHIIGHNSEACYIGNSICAERSAIVQLRSRPAFAKLRRIYIVTDADDAISPGMLCREFMSSLSDGDLHIVLANASCSVIKSVTLAQLFPFPSIYRHTGRALLLETGRAFVSRGLQHPSEVSADAARLYDLALKATDRDDRDHLHPLRYAAAALFRDGSVEVAWQKKGLEYGTTLDAVSQLAHQIESKARVELTALVLLLHVDHLGICHAPVATARAYLQEYGHGHGSLLIHAEADGRLREVKVADLAPEAPVIFN